MIENPKTMKRPEQLSTTEDSWQNVWKPETFRTWSNFDVFMASVKRSGQQKQPNVSNQRKPFINALLTDMPVHISDNAIKYSDAKTQ